MSKFETERIIRSVTIPTRCQRVSERHFRLAADAESTQKTHTQSATRILEHEPILPYKDALLGEWDLAYKAFISKWQNRKLGNYHRWMVQSMVRTPRELPNRHERRREERQRK